jgi:thioredoxin-related protein
MSFSLRAAALTLAGTFALAASATPVAGDGWVADFDEALKLAKAANKDLLVDFTGSDWCIWCKRLDSEVFSKPEFLEYATKELVLVSLDFPHSEEAKARVPNSKRNEELRDKYGVQGFPTVLLMTPSGEVFGQTGYRPGGPVEYVKHLTEVETTGKKELEQARTLIEAWNKAEGEAKFAAWDKIADALAASAPDSYAAKSLADPVRAALEFDKDGAKGKKKRAIEVLLAGPFADEAVITATKELDPKNEAGLLAKALKAQFGKVDSDEAARAALKAFDDAAPVIQDKETSFFLNANAAYWCAQFLEDLPKAKVYAQKAKEIGSDDTDMLTFLDQVLSK